MNAAHCPHPESWRWDVAKHRTPPALTIAVIEPTADQAKRMRNRRTQPKDRMRRMPFGFSRALVDE